MDTRPNGCVPEREATDGRLEEEMDEETRDRANLRTYRREDGQDAGGGCSRQAPTMLDDRL